MLDSIMNLLNSVVSSSVLNATVMFVVVLSVLVFIHELGHYLAAKTVGIKVRSFSIGFGKEIFGFTRKNGERWKISLFPLGGYVDLYGMDPDEEDVVNEKNKEILATAVCNKNVFARMWVVLAGPLSNFVFAVLAAAMLFYFVGVKELSTTIGEVRDGMSAQKAGVMAGDKVLAVSGEKVSNWGELAEKIATYDPAKDITLTIKRDDKEFDIVLPTEVMELENIYKEKESRRVVGIIAASDYIAVRDVSFADAVKEGFDYSVKFTGLILGSVKRIATGEMKADVGGPLTIAEQSGKAAKQGIYTLILFMVNLSINLFILNLLPIPVLDGGHLLYYTIEVLTFGRGLHEKIKLIANYIGAVFLGLLMLFVFYKDIERIFF